MSDGIIIIISSSAVGEKNTVEFDFGNIIYGHAAKKKFVFIRRDQMCCYHKRPEVTTKGCKLLIKLCTFKLD